MSGTGLVRWSIGLRTLRLKVMLRRAAELIALVGCGSSLKKCRLLCALERSLVGTRFCRRRKELEIPNASERVLRSRGWLRSTRA